ncbi:protein translocase subunit SecF [Nodularia spumigena CS-584]|jgi:preprotein translocase subunit SecF|uniref:Protein-export membrane protein SecF n=1 Tax=Nodularia spumigena UHCC 0060 TaxID=3110300 RepID=A0ABU5UMJ6_NODSP|nr:MULTISPECIES: protein translocase subunit SecF [Cyanophyceae]MDB9358622.1 protein translocase subunit SecF [Nodularia spumigena CS-587/03]AHJ30324.1 Protein-export membrane protein SecF [Nodularia spumigena CCY9414]EAW46667.1 protein export protein SecF [Nodularia spumigena CCY9414]MDB9319409.1 protein translocase subunit SecF [Nodularia spumigena CS-590/01A]MDB9320406.1 protein translocase subunit SecF [Nodularia spumigena CS-591/07A]
MKLSINKSRSLWWTISSAIILISIISMVISWQNPQIGAPLRPGLDFIGGTRLQFERDCTELGNCDQPIDINTVREVAQAQGLGDSSIQIVGENGISIRSKDLDVDQRTNLQTALTEKIGTFDPQKNQIDTVGPTLGAELFRSGIIALIVSFAGIIIYLTFRFQLDYALFAIVALFHDVLVTLGVFSIFGLVLGTEVDSLFIVSLLTIIGFSVNDTVVIYDRIRETIKVNPERPIADIVDDAVNQTLGRSINTSLTTMLPLFAIYFLGGETLKNFALALIIGFTAGAYSSLFIASTLLAWWRERTGKSPVLVSTEAVDTSASSQDG